VFLPARADQAVLAWLRASLGGAGSVPYDGPSRPLLDRADQHGVAGVVRKALREAGVALDPATAGAYDRLVVARELAHTAHREALAAADRALAGAGLAAVALKGPLLAERLYPEPAMRATGDVDLLVAEQDLETATRVLAGLGYVTAEGPGEERFRHEHHHVHLGHPRSIPLELHFHAYRGFGRTLRSEPLIARRRDASRDGLPLRAIGVLEPADELAYLAVHAAAHRFVRLGWLYDVALLLPTMTAAERDLAATRAASWGFARILAFTAALLRELLGVDAALLRSFGELSRLRKAIANATVLAPENAVGRSATRFAFTTTLCQSPTDAARYALWASRGRAWAWRRAALG
jgi:hypothetical protein